VDRSHLVASRGLDDGVGEAAEWAGTDWWMLGVQWHPEELDRTPETWDHTLFNDFAAAVAAFAPSRSPLGA